MLPDVALSGLGRVFLFANLSSGMTNNSWGNIYIIAYFSALHKSFSLSSSRSRRALFVLMYTLQRAKTKNAVAKTSVTILLSNNVPAVAIIVMRLITCSDISCLAFMVW